MSDERWAARVRGLAAKFKYPPTPDLAARRRAASPAQDVLQVEARRSSARRSLRRSLAWGVLVLLALFAAALAAPPVRAALRDVIQVGVVRIFLGDESAPIATLAGPEALLDLEGETSLDEAAKASALALALPGYPTDLGLPDRVFHQQLDEAEFVVLVWLVPDRSDEVRLSLHILDPGLFALKSVVTIIRPADLQAREAYWVEGPHFYQLQDGEVVPRRLVQGNVLLWREIDGSTYRLESSYDLDTTLRIAESLQPYPAP